MAYATGFNPTAHSNAMNPIIRRVYNSTLFRKIYHSPAGRFLYHFPADSFDFLTGRTDPLVPPRRLIFSGRGDYREIGRRHTEMFIEFCGLKPHEAVLEVGCGIGRMAVGLTEYINAQGTYQGFDIVPSGIRWCRKHISTRFPNFEFYHADIYNRMYNKKGRCSAAEFRFPCGDCAFDFVYLTSVFTHMLPADVFHYLEEIYRVLKSGGRCFATANLINDYARSQIKKKATALDYKYSFEHFYSVSNRIPEFNIGLDEEWLLGAYRDAGLKMSGPIRYGQWTGRRENDNFQDVIISCKI